MRRIGLLAAIILAAAAPAWAQQPRPLPVVVADIRLFTSKIGQDATTAGDLGVPSTNLPARANGFAGGATLYVYRGKSLSLGLGAEGILGRARATITDVTGASPDLLLQTHLLSVSGTLSLNFGHRDGWSYVSFGIGPTRIESYLGDQAPLTAPPMRLTPNFGGGARWFSSSHVAFCFDVRIYSTQRLASTAFYAGRDRKNMLVLSAGLAIR